MRKQKKPEYLKRTPNGVRPIMLYPRTDEERERIVRAAKASGQYVSPFILEITLGRITAELRRMRRQAEELEQLEKAPFAYTPDQHEEEQVA